jgi:hypothetical protein
MSSPLRRLVLTCCLLLPASYLFSARARIGEKPPKALLVELLARKNQVDYMKENNPERVPEIMKDIQSVMKATMLDFSMNFDYVPVYFFIDTNADKIKEGHFEGVLLDENFQLVKQTVLAEGDTNFYVAYFGAYMPQPQHIKPGYTNTNNLGGYRETAGDDPTALKKTLLVMDHNFELLQLPRPRTPRTYVSMARRETRKLFYRAKHSSIDYIPLAASYDATLRRYFRPRRVVVYTTND